MRRITALAAVITLLCSCAGWQATAWKTVDGAQKASEALVQSALPVINVVCEGEVAACEEAQDPECPGYRACAAVRANVVKTFVLTQIACANAEAALVIARDTGDLGDAPQAVADVVKLLQKLRTELQKAGIL